MGLTKTQQKRCEICRVCIHNYRDVVTECDIAKNKGCIRRSERGRELGKCYWDELKFKRYPIFDRAKDRINIDLSLE